MRILIVSDTHRKNENYFKVLQKMKKPDMIIHCGDIEGSEYALSEAADCPVLMVSGNNDFFTQLPREQELNIGNYKVWVTHGHNYLVSLGTERIKQEAKARGAQIVMFGHTHRPCLEQDEELIAVNPGSLSYPRQDGHKPTYALMEIDNRGEAHFTIAHL
jgi:putative phosphoesterase